jgi:pimeloyl-ACP methyl ester carboxylesterase
MTAHAATPTQPSTYGSDSGRARLPDASGFAVSSDGVRLAYDVYGTGEPTIAFLPSTPIVHARQWKAQIPYLSRHFRVVAYDGRGNGRSDRPVAPESYADPLLVDDVLAVLDASDTPRALLVGLCGDAVWRAVLLAGRAPERVAGIVAFATGVPLLSDPHPWRVQYSFQDELPTDEGWAKLNRHYWRRDYPGFVRFFFEEVGREPHSTKVIDDMVQWAAVDGSMQAMLADMGAPADRDREAVVAAALAVRCPMLLVHGTADRCQPPSRSRALAELTGARLVIVEGGSHLIPGRHPVLANLLIRDFARDLGGA